MSTKTTTFASSVIIFSLYTLCMMSLVCEGLPLYGQEPDTNYDDDIIAGEAFLAMLLGSTGSLSAPYPSRSHRHFADIQDTTPGRLQPQDEEEAEKLEESSTSMTLPATEYQKTVVRETRSSPHYNRRGKTYNTRTTRSDSNSETSVSNKSEDGMVIAVRVSSSIGQSLINKQVSESKEIQDTTTTEVIEIVDQAASQSEDHPSIIAEANKSDFSVDEGEPITRDNLNLPYHQSVIYHDNPKEPTRARSVSYSTVIQSLPQRPSSPKLVDKSTDSMGEPKDYYVKSPDSMAESKDYYVTSKPWRETYPTATTVKHFEPTERNWGIPEKNYGVQQAANVATPIVYGQPEQNYEVDEAVSVESNGRAHGVQPQPQAKNSSVKGAKDDDNQKVGYVVEGRNYRKYRVEERTSDGFIVGEYGVVSHNDGSLRGVRYTADGTISPRLIYDALMKFLAL